MITLHKGGEDTNTLYVGICGKQCIDAAVYLGQILVNLEKKVLIADLTDNNGLYYLFSVSERFPVTYGKVDYIGKEFHVCAKENDNYDIIILCMTSKAWQISGGRLSALYCISDMQYTNLLDLQREVKNSRLLSGVIIRDAAWGSITVPYLLKYVLKDAGLLRFYEKKRIYVIHDDITDREYFVNMQYGNFGEFRNLSGEYLSVLEKIAAEITGKQESHVKLALKYAKEGKNIEKHNILEQYIRKKRHKQ